MLLALAVLAHTQIEYKQHVQMQWVTTGSDIGLTNAMKW